MTEYLLLYIWCSASKRKPFLFRLLIALSIFAY
ncbi:hypothetical protein YPPY14_2951, partial [Yersinia pestis PY-14]